MISTTCAFCGRYSNFTVRWGHYTPDPPRVQIAATCDFCQEVSATSGPARRTSSTAHVDATFARNAAIEDELEWWPKVGHVPAIDDVPDHIAAAAREAYSSASVGNNMAAILMARTVVEATAKAKGVTEGNLNAKINALRDKSLIRPAIAEQAHEIRFLGNEMAHGDIDEKPSSLDAEETLALMAEVLSEVFQGPAKLVRLRSRRTTKSSNA
jgi:hypothetical protein